MLPASASRWSAIALIVSWVVEFPVMARRKSLRRRRHKRPCLQAPHRGRARDVEQQGDLTEVLALLQRPDLLAVHLGAEDSRGDEKHVLGGLALPNQCRGGIEKSGKRVRRDQLGR
jgi:hypothetical protein